MTDPQEIFNASDPFKVLGLAIDADQAQVRARYLELIKQFPPERDGDQFRRIHQAYESACDPLKLASQLIEVDENSPPPPWSDVIDRHRDRPPRLSPELLLGLGNKATEPTT